MGKWAEGMYRTDGRGTSQLNIKNPAYTLARAADAANRFAKSDVP